MPRLRPHLQAGRLEAGTDEVGRGCLAGPVVAAAVILRPRKTHPLLNDSKQLSGRRREELFVWIQENSISYAIAEVDNKVIDEMNILQASLLAMRTALDALDVRPDHVLVDGNRFDAYNDISHSCIIKGDGIYRSIAAASVLAKVYRDRLMCVHAEKYQGFGWERNAGYPTKEHRARLMEVGPTPLHRLSFRLLAEE